MKAFNRVVFLVLLSLTVGFLNPVETVSGKSRADASDEVVLEMPGGSGAASNRSMSDEETISVDFPDEDVRTVLRNVADIYELNVVIPDSLQGRTSIKLRNITWCQVFEVVLEPLGYTYIEDRNIIRIRKQVDLLREPVDTRVFIVNYSSAAELKAALLPLIDTTVGGRLYVDVRSNALVITERLSRMNTIKEIIESLDRATDQVVVEVKLFEVIQCDRSPSDVEVDPAPKGEVRSGQQEPSVDAIVRGESEFYSPQAFDQILGRLETSKGVRLVSSFNVTTLDDEDASIARVEKFPVPNYVFNEESGRFEVDGVKYRDAAVRFSVRSEVNAAGFIRLSMKTEVSHCTGNVAFSPGEGGMPLPMITSRSTSSTVMVKDGYTLSIGGMSEVINQSVVLAGHSTKADLAEGRKTATEKAHAKQFVMFVTAKTLNPDGATYRDSTDERVLHEMEILESDIPGYRLSDDQSKLLDEVRELRSEAARLQAKLECESALSDQLKQKQEALENAN
ncbi:MULTISPECIES: type II secretion system protein GspD [unclassified Lentimonas]|uniref:type II secretion system protein GspD n=1 Tax=unclassified Lentimonas TaxID=2630993 RepID=UPI00132BA42C|nr:MULTISPECIES: secretin N-terminal domain-containing protein [unclassified Lentimonas]CAA6694189.1 Unannotated [Lentimonas sp. CC19]CAA6694315.1 Unannotated [Lentimonas sp. CC10]CAA7070388.1 Unannotated [Lentimonas sp. CC11]